LLEDQQSLEIQIIKNHFSIQLDYFKNCKDISLNDSIKNSGIIIIVIKFCEIKQIFLDQIPGSNAL